jgi:xanthine dehydrogenase iron-sulfur cluster and FAD-binding subunit A
MADTPPEPPEGDHGDRIDRLERGQTSILGKLDELIGGAHAKAEQHEAGHLGRPTSVEEQVRAELDRADAARKAQAEHDADKADRQSIRERLAALTETAPVAPQPRRQRFMWGGR